jgi:hypothetical protein
MNGWYIKQEGEFELLQIGLMMEGYTLLPHHYYCRVKRVQLKLDIDNVLMILQGQPKQMYVINIS